MIQFQFEDFPVQSTSIHSPTVDPSAMLHINWTSGCFGLPLRIDLLRQCLQDRPHRLEEGF